MPFVTHEAYQLDTRQLGYVASQVQRGFARGRARPVQADIDLQDCPHPQPGRLHGAADGLGLVEVVKADDRIGFAAQFDEPLNLARAGDHVGNQQIADSRGGKDFGLAQFGTGQACRTGIEQAAGNVG